MLRAAAATPSFASHSRATGARFWTRDAGRVGAMVLIEAALLALVLALPGQTVTTRYLGDLFVALDGAHRVLAGQVPSRDFHTPLGPLATYIPAAGYWISGTLGGAMPVGMALIVAVLAPAMAHVFASRLHPIVALPLAAFLLLILAVPMNLGESVTSVSHAKFYNRVGWSALATLLVMYLRTHPEEERREWADVAAAAVLAGGRALPHFGTSNSIWLRSSASSAPAVARAARSAEHARAGSLASNSTRAAQKFAFALRTPAGCSIISRCRWCTASVLSFRTYSSCASAMSASAARSESGNSTLSWR
jgi:hypothetical protein